MTQFGILRSIVQRGTMFLSVHQELGMVYEVGQGIFSNLQEVYNEEERDTVYQPHG